mmetsp:Transcript_73547/g.227142  ORF Transcript_73547/g.227142 Transcript_73547/m.227142 type:complete len:290 (+) Transcript_73547:223-1092(+)
MPEVTSRVASTIFFPLAAAISRTRDRVLLTAAAAGAGNLEETAATRPAVTFAVAPSRDAAKSVARSRSESSVKFSRWILRRAASFDCRPTPVNASDTLPTAATHVSAQPDTPTNVASMRDAMSAFPSVVRAVCITVVDTRSSSLRERKCRRYTPKVPFALRSKADSRSSTLPEVAFTLCKSDFFSAAHSSTSWSASPSKVLNVNSTVELSWPADSATTDETEWIMRSMSGHCSRSAADRATCSAFTALTPFAMACGSVDFFASLSAALKTWLGRSECLVAGGSGPPRLL